MAGLGNIQTGSAAQLNGGGGSGGNANMDTVIQNLVAGANDVPHSLELVPSDWAIKDSSGRPMAFVAAPKPGSESTVLSVTALTIIPNARITVYAETP